MFNIALYLDKFKKIDLKSSSLKKTIHASISKVLGIDVDIKAINVKNNLIYLKVNPVIKNEIFIKKKNIIKELQLNSLNITDVF